MSTDVQQTIKELLQHGFGSVLELPWNDIDPIVRRTLSPELGDFQANGAMALGKKCGQNPRELAERVVENIDFGELVESAEVAGPGFINIRLTDDTIVSMLNKMSVEDLGVEPDQDTHPVAIDLCRCRIRKLNTWKS